MQFLARILSKPVAKVETVEDTPGLTPENYAALAKRAGFPGVRSVLAEESRKIKAQQFRRFLAENGIAVYDTRTVLRYLHRVKPVGHEIFWHRVNEAGVIRNPETGLTIETHTSFALWTVPGTRSYSKPIPEAVLMTMAKIREPYPAMDFFVSDFVKFERKADPFLAVLYCDQFLVIERWDEPGFRM